MHHSQHVVGGGQLTSGLPGVWGKARRHAGRLSKRPSTTLFWTQQTNKARCKKQREVEVVSVQERTSQTKRERKVLLAAVAAAAAKR